MANGFTGIGTGAAPKRGALFLDAAGGRGLNLAGPKIPPYQGEQLLPLAER
jgi:hypothetical protein